MPLICPNCRRELDYSKEPPRFCAFCGTRLAVADVTAAYEGDASGALDTSISNPISTSAPGRVGDYRLLRLLGAGGMGTVYEAESAQSAQKVAVKLLSSQFTANPISVERFRQEGKLASQITHPRCVFVLAADTDQGRPYIVMELMPGKTLKDLVDQSGPLSPHDAITKILDVIEGLQEAHRLGVIHRDVKPSNCFLMTDGRVKVGDFGLSKSLSQNHHLTQTGAFLGTVLYASPEQIRGQDVGYASDVYSVCATLYYLLCGRAPFEHESVTAALARVISEDPPPLRQFRPDVPKGLERVIMRGLEREADNRYQSLDELHDALNALIPSHLSFGGLWVRVGAYLVDELFVRLAVILPLTLMLSPFGIARESSANIALVIFPLYFVLLEGRYGASLGKRLLRLRVCHAGTTDPPGYVAAAWRTLIFYFLIIVTLTGPRVVIEEIDEKGLGWHLLREAIPFLIGMLILVVPMRKSNDYRGLHEWLSGTCVLRLPPRRKKLRFTSLHSDRIAALPPATDPVPKVIGPFAIRSASPPGADEERILIGEDTVLGRRVILRLYPATRVGQGNEVRKRFEVSRPTRLRALGHGELNIHDRIYEWEAFVAPEGTLLVDAIDSNHRLPWATTRSILEQITEELAVAEEERSLPDTLSLQQVWVESNGHAQLLDFVIPSMEHPRRGPLPRADEPRAGLKLLGKIASLALEGKPRDPDAEPGAIKTALPIHAARLLAPLMNDGKGYPSVIAFRETLHPTRNEPVEVTTMHRFGQIGVQLVLLGFGLLTMFLAAGLYDFAQWLTRAESAWSSKWVLDHYEAESYFQAITQLHPELAEKLSDPAFRQRFAEQAERDAQGASAIREQLRRGPRIFARTIEDAMTTSIPDTDQLQAVLERTQRVGRINDAWFEGVPFLRSHRQQTIALVVMWPVLWSVGAYLLNGGFSLPLTGLSLRRRDGKKPSRELLAVRTFMVWFPIAILLVGSVLIPGAAILWWLALALLIAYTICVLAMPERAPHDRALGLEIVPR